MKPATASQSPAAERSAARPAPMSRKSAKGTRERFTVDLVDDGDPLGRDINLRLRQFLKTALRRWGLRCLRIEDGVSE